MNNLKELNPVLNGVQKSSEDPLGFIYGTYRAAKTEVKGWALYEEPEYRRSCLCFLYSGRISIHGLLPKQHSW
jgi:hypothetical protein